MKNLVLLFLAALVLRITFAILFQFDGLYGQDPFAYFDYTIKLRQALAAGQPPPAFHWPIGYPLLAVLASLFTGLRPIAGQIVSILAGSLVAPLVYLITLEVNPKAWKGGIVAGLLFATAAQSMFSSISYMADTAGLVWVTLSFLTMLRYGRTLQPRWLLFSAFTLGWAVLTRWAFAPAAFPLALAAFVIWHKNNIPWARRFQLSALAILIGGLVLGSQFLPSLGQEEVAHAGNLRVVQWDPTNAFKSTVTNADGVLVYERPFALYYALPVLHPAFVFPLLFPFLLVGLWTLRKRPLYQIALITGWPLIMYLFLAGTAWQNSRFILVYFPPLTILVGLGFQALWTQPPKSLPTKLNTHSTKLPITNYQLLLTLYLAISLIGSLAWTVRDLRNLTSANNAQIAASRWVEAQVPLDAQIVTFGVTLTMQHRTELEASDIFLHDPDSLADLLQNGRPLYLFLDLDNINGQWNGLSPHQNYLWLQENGRLTEIDQYPPYTLFEVTPQP